MIGEILFSVCKANLAAGAAIVLVLALRPFARRHFGARVAYGLWLAVPVAGFGSLVPARTIMVIAAPPQTTPAAPVLDMAPTLTPAFLGVWLVGAILCAGLFAWRQHRFVRGLGRIVRDGVYLRAQTAGAGPAVIGVFAPRIVVPGDFEARFSAPEREVILAHEAAHLAAGDTLVNALVCLWQCVGWFNPLVHLGARALRHDQELACDAAVLSTHSRQRHTYAEALLKAQLFDSPLPLGCYWPASASHPLKERIAMLKQQSPSRARLAMGVASVAALCLGGGFAAWAAQPAEIAIQPAAEPQTTQQPSMVTVTSAPSDEVVVYQPSRATSGAAARPAQPAQPSAVQMSAQTSPAVSLDEQDPHVRTIVGRKLKVVQTATLDGDTFVATGISHEGNPAGVRVTVTRVPISAEEAQALASAGSSSTSNIFVAAGERAGSAPTSEFFAATPAPSAP